MKKINSFILMLSFFLTPFIDVSAANEGIEKKLSGQLLLGVEQGGTIWYVDNTKHNKHQVTWNNALLLFQEFAIGITDEDLLKIPTSLDSIRDELDSDGDGYTDKTELSNGYNPYSSEKNKIKIDVNLANRMKGNFLLQTQQNGAIWYVDMDGIRHNARWDNLMPLFQNLSLGINNQDLNKITTKKNTQNTPITPTPTYNCTTNQDCNDNNPNTTDICLNPSTSFADCQNTPITSNQCTNITQYINNDGCCPNIANGGTPKWKLDNDCPVAMQEKDFLTANTITNVSSNNPHAIVLFQNFYYNANDNINHGTRTSRGFLSPDNNYIQYSNGLGDAVLIVTVMENNQGVHQQTVSANIDDKNINIFLPKEDPYIITGETYYVAKDGSTYYMLFGGSGTFMSPYEAFFAENLARPAN